MSTKRRNAIIGVLALAIIIALIWISSNGGIRTPGQPKTPSSVAGQSPISGKEAQVPLVDPTTIPPTQKPSMDLGRTFETLNHNSIEFYGRVVDQSGAAVPGANIRGIVIVNSGKTGGQMVKSTNSDGEGYFQFSGFKGQDLGIDISKEGYEYRRRNSSFSYTYFEADHKRHIADAKNPVVFILWKKQGAERLVQYDRTLWDIPADGTPVRIDLETGEVGGTNADFVLSLVRTPLKMRFGQRGYAWELSVEIVGGGLVRAGDRDYYNVAPESGYEPRLQRGHGAQSVRDAQEGRSKWTWEESASENLFVRSLDGARYARVRLSVYSNGRNDNDTTGSATIAVWLNPTGSRNLEFDPAQAVKP